MNTQEKKYTETQAKEIWKAGQEYWRTNGASITFEELTEQMNGGKKNQKLLNIKKS